MTIQNIYRYIKYRLYSLEAAERFSNNINSIVSLLKQFPRIGKMKPNDSNRFLVYKKYLIFYEIKENEKLIIIKKIIHSNVNRNRY